MDLGGEKRLSEVSVDWEFPAKAFTVSVSTVRWYLPLWRLWIPFFPQLHLTCMFGQDGIKWSEVYATDSNILSSSSISLGAVPAAKVRMVMREVRLAALSSLLVVDAWWLVGFGLGDSVRGGSPPPSQRTGRGP